MTVGSECLAPLCQLHLRYWYLNNDLNFEIILEIYEEKLVT